MSAGNCILLFVGSLFAVLVVGVPVDRSLLPDAVGVIRRRDLVARRRLGQGFARRLALELSGLGFGAAEIIVHLLGKTLLRLGLPARRNRRPGRLFLSRGQLVGGIRHAFLPGRKGCLASFFIRIFRPVRGIHLAGGGRRRRQIELWRHHQRGSLAIVDPLAVHVGGGEGGLEIVHEFFAERPVILVVAARARGADGHHETNA